MWIELLTGSVAQLIYAIAGIAIFIAIAYYVLSNMKSEINAQTLTKEEHLVEFDRMLQDGSLEPEEFKEVKKKLAPDIVKQAHIDKRNKSSS